ncbi:MAG: hypothetical protein P4L90_15120 [Rhodopila sp.]|nr:hypothetical protein [Rhodopila sp.]
MSIFETLGQAQMLSQEGNRQIAATLADASRKLMQRFARFLGETLRHVPNESPQP